MPKYTLTPPPPPSGAPVTLQLVQESYDGCIRIDAVLNGVKAELLRFTRDGKVALIIGQEDELKKLGFQVSPTRGTIAVVG